MKVNKPGWNRGWRRATAETRRRGFTLFELLMTVATIVLLAALMLPALNNAKHRALQTTCLNNLNQLGLSMTIYMCENKGAFPGMASARDGFNAADWIYWRTNTAYPAFEISPILRGASGLQKQSLRCPLDASAAGRFAQAAANTVNGPYLFSYSFTGYGVDSYPNLPAGVNLGMSSVFTAGQACVFLGSDIRNPSAKLMLVEEPGSVADSPDHASVINDGRWMPGQDRLTTRHRGWANVTFVDGHAQQVRPEFGDNLTNSLPSL
jgi:prepilin-type processing-associated H-X9-DG protein